MTEITILPREVLTEIIKFAVCGEIPMTPGLIIKCVKIFVITPEELIAIYAEEKYNITNTPEAYSIWCLDVLYYILSKKYTCDRICDMDMNYSIRIRWHKKSGSKRVKKLVSHWLINWDQPDNKFLSVNIQCVDLINPGSQHYETHMKLKWHEVREFVVNYISKNHDDFYNIIPRGH